jgi:hypothetical protein
MNKDEALRLALEALEAITRRNQSDHQAEIAEDAITAIKAALDTKDEPQYVAFMDSPQRTWVGLTDEEVDQFHNWKDCTWSTNELVRYVEAKLKEKNT